MVTFATQMEGVNLDSLDNDGYADRALTSEDTTLKGGTVTSRLPLKVQASALFLANRYWSMAGMAKLTTESSAWGRAGGEGGLALGYRPWGWLRFQGDAIVGGAHGQVYSLVTGLRVGGYELDLGGAVTGGVFGGARGAGVSVAQRIAF